MKKILILFVFLLCFGLCDCLQKEGTQYNSQASNYLDIARINGNHGLLSLMQMKPAKLK